MTDTSKLGKIFIGGLSYETTDEKLRSYFGAYGSVTDAVVMKDPISRRSRGFGFITYADPACVDRALAQPNHILDSRRVEAKRAVPRAENSRETSSSSTRGNVSSVSSVSSNSSLGATKKIFVGGLHYETKDADFKKYFQQYGKVVSAEVMFNRETNKSRGFGFVIFETEDSVDGVLEEQNHVIDGKSVEVKRAVPRTDVPPTRTSSSPGDSFGESVDSPEDVSLSTAAPSSSTTNGSNAPGDIDNRPAQPSTTGNFLANGTLGGYAAAVRYGGRGARKPASPAPAPQKSDSVKNSPKETSTDGVAEGLDSLVLSETVSTPVPSVATSIGSEKQLDLKPSGTSSPLTSAIPLEEPMIDRWSLSPNAAPIGAPEQSESKILKQTCSQGSGSRFPSWQAQPTSSSSSWQQWSSQHHEPLPLDQTDQGQHQPPPAPPSFFSMFSGDNSNGGASNQSAWGAAPPYGGGASFGGMMGMGLDMDGGNGFGGSRVAGGSFEMGGGIGMGMGMGIGMGMESHTNPGSYGSLGGLLHQDYPTESIDSSIRFGSMMGDVLGSEQEKSGDSSQDHMNDFNGSRRRDEYQRSFR